MPHAFVTGATGFLGRHLVDVLGEAGWQITAMVRDPAAAEALFGTKVRLTQGDLTDPESVRGGMPKGTDAVFHTAADTSTWARHRVRQHAINVQGTQAVIEAATAKKAGRLIHVSSIAVFGIHHGIITEESETRGTGSRVSYVKTKAAGEACVRAAVQEGRLDAVIVNPTHIVGRYDTHNWARLIRLVADGSLPGIPPGGGNFANGRTVAEAMLAAVDRGRRGEHYILGGPNARFTDFIAVAGRTLNTPVTAKETPAWLLKGMARFLVPVGAVTGRKPLMTPEEAYFACESIDASSAKAVDELGYREISLEQSIAESVTFLRDQGLVT